MLCAENLKVCYEDNTVLEDFSISIHPGEILTIIGPNGSGKSTALRTMARLYPHKEGMVYLNGVEMKAMKSRTIARTLSFVSQDHIIPPDMTVEELVGRGRTPHHSLLTRLSGEDRQIVNEALAETQLTTLKDRSIYALSGGERQRAFIAMALAQHPSILFLDEPTTYLDISFQYELLEVIKKFNSERKLTIVMVLHDINQAARYSDRIAVLKNGRMQALGTPWEIVTEEQMRTVYGMQVRILCEEFTGRPYLIPLGIAKEAN